MATLTIKNIGPIKSVENIELNKVNVFMGPQSSGKSTIAKIISYCTWVEKKYLRDGLPNRPDINDLVKYHRLTNGYLCAESSFHYQSELMSLSWDTTNNFIMYLNPLNKRYNSKVLYIPAERNFVSVFSDIITYAKEWDSIRGLIDNWFEAKRKYDSNNRLEILELGVRYFSHNDSDKLYLDEEKKEISLQIASSGLQSVVPLLTLADYALRGIYAESKPMSVEEQDELVKEYNKMLQQKRENNDNIDSKDLELLLNLLLSKNYANSQLIIEEPEQNLFPSTQRDLMYHLLKLITGERDHRLTITTHSPYILYALNNCMMGYLVKEKMIQDEDYVGLKSLKSAINPTTVSVWQISDKGTVYRIQGEDKLIESNYFDTCMKEVMDDYYKMINYYGDEETD